MKQTLKRIVSFMLVLTCVITMFPVSTFADSFVTNSGTTAGGGKKYNEKANWVNVGYRISLYYEGKESDGRRYLAPIAYNESGKKPLMANFSSKFTSENYIASSKQNATKVSTTFFRDVAAKKASILVLNSTGDAFDKIYSLSPTSDYKATKQTWTQIDKDRICKKDSNNKAYKWINAHTDNALSTFQGKTWLGTKQGASAIVNADALNKIDKAFAKRGAKEELIKAFRDVADDSYITKCLNNADSVFIQIEPVAIFSNSDYGNTKGFLATWSQARWACSDVKTSDYLATKRGCFSWRSKANPAIEKALISAKTTKKLSSKDPKDVDVKVVYYGTSYENSTNRAAAAASIMGTLYNKKVWNHSTQLTKAFSTASGVAYFGCSETSFGNVENVASISLFYTGELDETSMNIENGKWTQANAVATLYMTDDPKVKAIFGDRNTSNIELTKYIDYANQQVLKKYSNKIYTYTKSTNYEGKSTKAVGSVGYSTKSNTKDYNLVAFYNYLIDNKKANVKTSTLAKNLNDATVGLIKEKGKKGQSLKATWKRSTVGASDNGLNAGYTVNFKNIKYDDGKNEYYNMFNIVSNKVLKPAYKDLKADYALARVLAFPYYKEEKSDTFTRADIGNNTSNILSDNDTATQKVLIRNSIYSSPVGQNITNNVLTLGGNNSFGTQAYYLEGVAFKGLLGSATTTMTKLGQIAKNKKYAMNILIGAKIADVKSYYTWATYDFTSDSIASSGTKEKTYDITSYGLFPLGADGQKGIKRVIIVPNKGVSKTQSDMAISQNELTQIVENGCRNASEDKSESEILQSIWNELRNKLQDNTKYYKGSIREHYEALLDDFADKDKFKHNGSETAAVGFYQNDNVESATPDKDEEINEEGSDFENTEIDESENPEDTDDTEEKEDGNELGQEETEDVSGLAQYGISLSEKEFTEKMYEFFKTKGVTQIAYEDADGYVIIKIGDKIKDFNTFVSSLASNSFTTYKGENDVDIFTTDNPLRELAQVIDANYKEPSVEDKLSEDFYNDGDVISSEDSDEEGVEDTGKDIDNTIEDTEKNQQRGYTIIGVGYTGKRTKTKGIDLQPWELNFVYYDLQAALQASNDNKNTDKKVTFKKGAYASTISADSATDIHNTNKSGKYVWSYTGNRDVCADGHTSLTEAPPYYKDHSGRESYATVSYVPSEAAWANDDSLFSYNIIVSDETKERNGSVDDTKNSNYTYSINKNKLHADKDDDYTRNHYSLILQSDEIMHDMWDDTNSKDRHYKNTAVKWNTWSRISKNFNHAKDYKTHYFTVNTMREAAYFSYVYNLIRYISGDERVASSIFNYNAQENINQDLKKDSAITDFIKECLLMKTDNVPNLEVAHLSQSSDKAQKRIKAKFNVPYYRGDGNARDYISEHITLNAYMQDDDDNLHYDPQNHTSVDITNYNLWGQNGEVYHTYKKNNMSHSSRDAKETIQWTQNVATTLNILSSEHCHKETGSWGHWAYSKYSGTYWCGGHSYSTDLNDVPAKCYHNRTIRGVMPAVFAIRTVDIDTGKLGKEESSDSYNLDYGETIYKYITESMEMGENNQKTGVIDTNGDMINPDATVDTKMNDSIGHEAVSSEKAQGGNSESNSKIETNFHTAFFDAQSTDKMNKTAFGFYPEVNMLAYEYGRGQKLSGYKGVTPYVVPVMGEVARSAKGANLYFMTTKQNSYKGFVSKNGAEDTTLNLNHNDFSGSTLSDSVASGTQADALQKAQAKSSCNTDKSKEQVIYAGSDVTVTGDSNFSLNLYGYSLDLINKDDVITKEFADTKKYQTYTAAYTDVVADNSNIYQKWYEVINGTYKDIIAAVKADSPIRTADSNREIMNTRYNEWSKEVTKIDNWTADYTLNVHGNGYNSKFTNFSATIGTLKNAQGKEATTSQTDVYSLHIKNGDIIKTDGSYVAMINQIAMDYFGDEATDVSGTVTLTNGVQVAKLKHYDAAQELFEKSDIGSSVKNAIESSSDDFNKSGSCFSDGDSRGISSIGSVKNWYDEEVRTIVVRRFKTEPLYFKGITASDKIDYNIAPDADTMTENWKGRQADWYLNLYYKADDKVDEFGTTASTLISGANRKFQVIKDLYVDNASFIVPSATTDNMGW